MCVCVTLLLLLSVLVFVVCVVRVISFLNVNMSAYVQLFFRVYLCMRASACIRKYIRQLAISFRYLFQLSPHIR